jgi:integrase
MVGACTRNSDRAIIMMLYECGFRIGEIGGVKWGVIASVNFKTGKPRYVHHVPRGPGKMEEQLSGKTGYQ